MRNKRFPNLPDDADYNTNAPSYYEDLARKEKLIRLLAERIWGYEKIVDETLEQIQERFRAWDKNLEDFSDDVKELLQVWMDNGTFDHIINDTIFKTKADQADLENVTAQLQQTEQVLSERVSQTIATAGDGTIPSELTDMRVTADGTSLTVAGDALRATQTGDALLPESVRFYHLKKEETKVINVSGPTSGFQNSNAIGMSYHSSYTSLLASGVDLSAVKTRTKMKVRINSINGSGEMSLGLKVLGDTTNNDLLPNPDNRPAGNRIVKAGSIVSFDIVSPVRDYTGTVYNLTLYAWATSTDKTTDVSYTVLEHSLQIGDYQLTSDMVTTAAIGSAGKVYSETYEGGLYTKSEADMLFAKKEELPDYDTPKIFPNYLEGKRVIALGDSMVKGHNLSDSATWLSKMATRNNMSYVNYGINGTYISNKLYSGHSGAVIRYLDMVDDADYIIVFAGTNDASAVVEMGTDNSTDIMTFKGALNVLCDGLITKYPTKKIAFITPYLRNANYPAYVAAIETICGKYGISVFNNIKNGGVSWTNAAQLAALTLNDTYHLNEAGMEYASYKYEAFLRSL